MELTKRYKTYEILKKNIPRIDKCLEKSTGGIFEFFYYGNFEYKVKDLNVFLLKVIGDESTMGTIYLSKLNNYNKKFVTKLMLLNDFSMAELEITEYLSHVAYITKNIHLPLLYGHSLCNDIKDLDLKLMGNKDVIKNQYLYNPQNSYYSLFIELYEGSLGILLLKLYKNFHLNSNEIFFRNNINNIIMQCFIGILTCHINNIIHYDTKINNFLYQKSNLNLNNNYSYEYLYSDLKFNLKSRPFIISICDFGISKFKDYYKNLSDDFYIKMFKKDYKLLLDTLTEDYIEKYKLQKIINLDLIYELIEKSNDDYELFKLLIENKFFDDIQKNNKNKKIIIFI
jgi:serine/threonine protein kinase